MEKTIIIKLLALLDVRAATPGLGVVVYVLHHALKFFQPPDMQARRRPRISNMAFISDSTQVAKSLAAAVVAMR